MTIIDRTFQHAKYGKLGHIKLTAPNEGWSLETDEDLFELDANAVAHLLNFSLQTFQDAYAGAKDETSARAAFEKKLNRAVQGLIGVRASGPRDPVRTKAIANAMSTLTIKDAKEKRLAAIKMVEADKGWLEDAQADLDRAAKRAAEQAAREAA